MGALGIANRTGIVSPSYAIYRPHRSSRLVGEFAELLLRTTLYKYEYVRRSTCIRSSRLRLYPEEILRITLLCLPPEEQDSIVEFVDRKSEVTCRCTSRTCDQLTHVNEYLIRLIADVVTGKLVVREVATRLPEFDPLATDDTLEGGHARGRYRIPEEKTPRHRRCGTVRSASRALNRKVGRRQRD